MKKMNVRLALLVTAVAVLGLLLVACGDNTPTGTPPPTTSAPATTAAATTAPPVPTTAPATTVAGVSPLATATALPATTAVTTTAAPTTAAPTTAAATTAAPTTAPATTAAPTTAVPATTAASTTAATTAPANAPAVSGNPADVNKNLFLDDRSNAIQVLRSFYNAINRKEYVRAYSYYPANSSNFPPYQQFAAGYKDTASVELFLGSVTAGVGAGNIYYGVPFSLRATATGGAATVYAGCYTVHGATDPRVFGAPPFVPLAIESGKVQAVPAGGNTASIMASSCQDTGGQTVTITPVPNDDSAVAANYFLDDRSSPEAVLRSFYNAINRKEYVRAYGYYVTQDAPGSYEQFAAGYTNAGTVQLTTGTPTSDAGAGQINYTVPVKLTVKNTDGSTQTFSGNYTLHKAQPANFGAPPFEPLGITGASIK